MPQHLKDSQAHNIERLTIEDFELMCFDLARELLVYGEPIPDYTFKDIGKLESALALPQQTFGGKYLYPTLTKQASILFYALIKNHAFQNGNKRIAVISLLIFLSINNKWLDLHPNKLYDLACKVSASNAEDMNKTLVWIEEEIEQGIAEE